MAETEHLASAAKALHVSPSALSRSVKHLEDELGQPLFDRAGRRMKLNRAGAELLAAVRDAMRRIDDGLELASTAAELDVQIAGPSAWLQLVVLPAIHDVPPGDPRRSVALLDGPPADVVRALLRGDVDLVVGELACQSPEIAVDYLGAIEHVLCGRRAAAAAGAHDELPFAVWTAGSDAWPPRAPRDIALRTPHLGVLVDACRAGRVQAILPFAIARAHGLEIRRAAPLPSTQLYLTRRCPRAASALDDLSERIRAHAAVVLARAALQVLA